MCRLARPSNRWLKRPTPNASRRCPPFKSSTASRSCSYGLFPWVACFASLSAKKYGTPYFSARNRTSKYSRSCSQSVAELLHLRAARTLRYIRVIWRGTSAVVGWKGFNRRCVAPSFWFAESIVSGIGLRTATKRQAEAIMAGLSVADVAETEHALSIPLTNAGTIYKANLDSTAQVPCRAGVIHRLPVPHCGTSS